MMLSNMPGSIHQDWGEQSHSVLVNTPSHERGGPRITRSVYTNTPRSVHQDWKQECIIPLSWWALRGMMENGTILYLYWLLLRIIVVWENHLKRRCECDDPDSGAHRHAEDPLSHRGISVVPGPPEELDPGEVIRGVDHLPHQTWRGGYWSIGLILHVDSVTCEGGGGQEGQAESPSCHSADVHEHDVHAGDVERHAGCDHDARLRLPEVVHEGEKHEDGVIGGAGGQGGQPDQQVPAAVSQGMDQRHQGQEDEEKLPDDEGGHHQEPLHGVIPVVPGQGVPLRVVINEIHLQICWDLPAQSTQRDTERHRRKYKIETSFAQLRVADKIKCISRCLD